MTAETFSWPPTSEQCFRAADWVVQTSKTTVSREDIAEALAIIPTLTVCSSSVPVLLPTVWPDLALEVLFVPDSGAGRKLPKLVGLELSKPALDAIGEAFLQHFLQTGNDLFLLEEHGLSLYVFMEHVRPVVLQASGVELVN
jgi:hypothetical protein